MKTVRLSMQGEISEYFAQECDRRHVSGAAGTGLRTMEGSALHSFGEQDLAQKPNNLPDRPRQYVIVLTICAFCLLPAADIMENGRLIALNCYSFVMKSVQKHN